MLKTSALAYQSIRNMTINRNLQKNTKNWPRKQSQEWLKLFKHVQKLRTFTIPLFTHRLFYFS